MQKSFMIYGANGYTGELTARVAAKQGIKPILAGRDQAAVEEIANRLDLQSRTFSLEDHHAMDSALQEVDFVLHLAGPFNATYRSMVEACLRTKTHYLDITGEPSVFQSLQALDADAKQAGIMILPGIGLDVAPSDCLAAHLKSRLPAATHLALAFRTYGPADLSIGTLKTFIENLGEKDSIRSDGKITLVPRLSKKRNFDFGKGSEELYRMTWGDVFTAYHSTGIPNIENYFNISDQALMLIRMSRYFRPLMGTDFVQNALKKQVASYQPGPTDEEIERSYVVFWGEAKDADDNIVVSRITTPEGYYLTALTCLLAAQKISAGNAPIGYQTPSSAYGADFIMEIENVAREDLI